MSVKSSWIPVLGAILCAGSAVGQVRSFAGMTFIPPEGWQYSESEVAEMSLDAGNRYCDILVFRPQRSTGDNARDFRSAWVRTFGARLRTPVPGDMCCALKPEEHKSLAGYFGIVGATRTDSGAFLKLFLLAANGYAVPVGVMASNEGDANDQSFAVGLLLDSVRMAPDRPAILKRQISLADLAGVWNYSSDSSVIWVNSVGTYVGSSVTAIGQSYSIDPGDGTYHLKWAGLMNGPVRGTQTGTVNLRGDIISLRDGKDGHVTSYRLISLQQGISGHSVLTVLSPQYQVYSQNINQLGEKWVRAPADH